MIGPGWLPRYRPRGLSSLRRTRAYSRGRRRGTRKHATPALLDRSDEEAYALLVSHGPAEFPIATARPREARGQLVALVGGLQRWLVARWQWLRPRSVPCAVAGLGMMAVLASADYLAHYKEDCIKAHAPVVRIDVAPLAK